MRSLQQGHRALVLAHAEVLFEDAHLIAQAIIGRQVVLGNRQLAHAGFKVCGARVDLLACLAFQCALQGIGQLLVQVVVKVIQGGAQVLFALDQFIAQAQVFLLLVRWKFAHERGHVCLHGLEDLLLGPAFAGQQQGWFSLGGWNGRCCHGPCSSCERLALRLVWRWSKIEQR
nr:hypothetical protein [Pseudomonas sp. GL93]